MKNFNYKLDKILLPKVWVYWNTQRDGDCYLNCSTGKIKHTPEPWMKAYSGQTSLTDGKIPMGYNWNFYHSEKIWVHANSRLHVFYAKYHKDRDVFEMAIVQMDTCRQPVPHEWKIVDRIFVKRDKSIYNSDGLQISNYFGSRVYAWDKKNIISAFLKVDCNSEKIVAEFKKFIGADYFIIGNGSSSTLSNAHTVDWSGNAWYQGDIYVGSTSGKNKDTGSKKVATEEYVDSKLVNLSGLPTVTADDAGKILRVSAEGIWIVDSIPVAEDASF
jgi:hypothetical protein